MRRNYIKSTLCQDKHEDIKGNIKIINVRKRCKKMYIFWNYQSKANRYRKLKLILVDCDDKYI